MLTKAFNMETMSRNGLLLIFGIQNAMAGLSTLQYIRCYDERMDKMLCEQGYTIRIYNAFYIDDGYVWSCSKNPPEDCKANIAARNIDYYREIVAKCEGRRSCEGLVAGKVVDGVPCAYGGTDHVKLEYTCDLVTTTAATTEPPPTTSPTFGLPETTVTQPDVYNTTAHSVVTAGSDTAEPGDVAPQEGFNQDLLPVFIGVPVVLVLVVLIIIAVTVLLRKRRKSNDQDKEQAADTPNGHPTSTTTYANAIYANSDIIDRSNYTYDKAATVALPTRRRGNDGNSENYMEMSSPPSSNRSSEDTMDHPQERIYSLEKVPTEEPYQPFESPYIEPDAKPTEGSQYLRMTGYAMSEQGRLSDPYAEVCEPTRLQDLEGVYSVPRNSNKLVDRDSVSTTEAPSPTVVNYENIYQNPQMALAAAAAEAEALKDPQSCDYSEIKAPQETDERRPYLPHQMLSVTSDTVLMENNGYSER